jgi:endoglucanase
MPMKSFLYRLLYFICLIFFLLASNSFPVVAQVPFSKGVNITGWFQASSSRQIQFSKFTKTDFQRIKSLGCDVIRLPINLHSMTTGAPDYVPDPLFLQFLDEAVTWAEELELYIILDNHTFDPAANTDPAIGPVLVKVWERMASHFKDRSDYVIYEILNEPHGIDNAVWSNIQQTVINAIRSVDTKHFIIVGAANFNTYTLLKDLPVYSDTKLIYTFHFYDPFIFTHQGATWTDPSLAPLAGVPFPHSSATMPPTPATLKGTWVESAINNYFSDGTINKVKSLIDIAANFKDQRSARVFCGEFGVYIPNSSDSDRVKWYEVVRQYFETKGIPWTIWDYTGGFGLFEKNSNELFDYDLNVPMLQALGMSVPEQRVFIKKPQTTGFLIYDDFIAEGINDASFPGAGILDYYSLNMPKVGSRCIYWTNVAQYNSIAFDFKPDLDLSLLTSHDHTVELWVRGNNSSGKFDLRFIDTKVNPTDRPWRMGKMIDQSIVPWDGQWHKVSVALKDFRETGAWDNAFFSPEGKFDWKNIDRFEIVSEYGPLTGIEFWFDDIRVAGEEVPYEEPEPVTSVVPETEELYCHVFPNPMDDELSIGFKLAKPGHTNISIYSPNGPREAVIIDAQLPEGVYHFVWKGQSDDGRHLPAGLYFLKMTFGDRQVIKKVLRLR